MDKVIREKLYRTRNDVNLTKMITDYVGNTCDKCGKESKCPLKYVMSFNKDKGNYQFYDIPGGNYHLKKFCKACCWSKASSAKIYIEI